MLSRRIEAARQRCKELFGEAAFMSAYSSLQVSLLDFKLAVQILQGAIMLAQATVWLNLRPHMPLSRPCSLPEPKPDIGKPRGFVNCLACSNMSAGVPSGSSVASPYAVPC